jgi:hypothetical protein
LHDGTNLGIFTAKAPGFCQNNRRLGGSNGQIWTRRRQIGEERSAPQEKGNLAVRKRRQRRKGEEPKAGHCHWSFGSSKEGGQSSAEEIKLTTPTDRAQATCIDSEIVRSVRPEAQAQQQEAQSDHRRDFDKPDNC